MKRVLIWDKKSRLSNSGGPSGYMWNIKQYLDRYPTSEVKFYSDVFGDKNRHKFSIKQFHPIRLILILLNFAKIPIVSRLFGTFYAKGILSNTEKSELKKFDFVHFHNISLMYAYGKAVQRLGVKTILTTHTPEVMVDEIFGETTKGTLFLNKYKKLREYFIKREKRCLEKTDYLMYPVEQISECFDDAQSKIISDYLRKNKDKIFYVPTSIQNIDIADNDSAKILDNLELPDNAIKICYVGRHNEVKGYPYLKEVAAELLKKRRDVYFIIGGKLLNEEPLDDANWIELGWVNTNNLLKEVDLFILPNQKTYFDIIALEILRAGIPLITTYTGGNKYLASLKDAGIAIMPKDDAKKAADILLSLLDVAVIKSMGNRNRQLFETEFSMEVYIKKYISAISKL